MEQVAHVVGDLPGDLDCDMLLVCAGCGVQACVLAVGEVLTPGAQDHADPVQRVALSAAVGEGVVLDAAAHVVDAGGREFDDVERVDDRDRIGQVVIDRVLVSVERIQRADLDAGTRRRRGG